jgi:hypothetical protein
MPGRKRFHVLIAVTLGSAPGGTAQLVERTHSGHCSERGSHGSQSNGRNAQYYH